MGLLKNVKDKLLKKVDSLIVKEVEGIPPEIGSVNPEEVLEEEKKEEKSGDFDFFKEENSKKTKASEKTKEKEDEEDQEDEKEQEDHKERELEKRSVRLSPAKENTDRPIGEQFEEELEVLNPKKRFKQSRKEKVRQVIKTEVNISEEKIKEIESKNKVLYDELLIKLEKIGAVLEAFEAYKKFNSERIENVSEQIGELRSNIINNERDIKTIEVNSTRAFDLVKEVQPEKLMTNLQRQVVRLDTIKTRFDSLEEYNKTLLDEIKSIKSKMGVFRGTEQILGMQEDIRKDIIGIQKIKTIVESHADKVEEIFMNIKNDVASFEKLSILIKDLTSSFNGLRKDMDEIKIKTEDFALKDDLAKIKEAASSQLHEFDKTLTDLKKEVGNLNKVDYLSNKLTSMIRKNSEEIEDLNKKITEQPSYEEDYVTKEDLRTFKDKVALQLKELDEREDMRLFKEKVYSGLRELDSSIKEIKNKISSQDKSMDKEEILDKQNKNNLKMRYLLGIVDKLSRKITNKDDKEIISKQDSHPEKGVNYLTIPEIIKKTGMKREEVLYKLSKKSIIKAKENPDNLDIKAEIKKELLKNRKKRYRKHKKRISKALNVIKFRLKGTSDKVTDTIKNGLGKFPSKKKIKKNILRKEKVTKEAENKNNLSIDFENIQPEKEIPEKNSPELSENKPNKVEEYKKEGIIQGIYAKTKDYLKKSQEKKKYTPSIPAETSLFLDLIEIMGSKQIKKENKSLEKTNIGKKFLNLGNNFMIKTKKYFIHNKNKLNKLKSRKLFKWPDKEKNNLNISSETGNFLNLINPEHEAIKERRFFKEQFWKRYKEKQEDKEPKAAEKEIPDEKINNEKGYWKKHLSEFYKQKYKEKKELNQEERKALQQTFSHHFMKKKELTDSAMLPLIKNVQEHFKIESKKSEPVLSQDTLAKRNRENIYKMLKERGINAEEPKY
ncbi:hypothetical protein HYX16_05235 [Candidatus Woesearchaeota archaeon]|nr:hypothetical protein [Candidatus Woesearchaeota archaeon]